MKLRRGRREGKAAATLLRPTTECNGTKDAADPSRFVIAGNSLDLLMDVSFLMAACSGLVGLGDLVKLGRRCSAEACAYGFLGQLSRYALRRYQWKWIF